MAIQEPDIAARRGPLTVEILRLRIDLADVSPTVTRTLLVRATTKLTTLHRAIQGAMGWENYHMYEFEVDGVFYAEENPFEMEGDIPRKSVRTQTGTVLREDGDTMLYNYDFGDGWEHLITREAELPPDLQLRRPTCIAGENACPPEDVGGPSGYMEYLEAVLDPGHPEHAAMIKWRGPGFHPHRFSIDEAEARVQYMLR